MMRSLLPLGLAAALAASAAGAQQSAPAPELEYAFTVKVDVAPPVEMGSADGGRKRFIAITGGTVSGPALTGTVLPGGGDWQVIEEGGLTRLEARYFLKSADGTVIEVTNIGVRVASPEVTDRLAKLQIVDPSEYYFRTTPIFNVTNGAHAWLRRSTFVARGIRKPDRVLIDVYRVK